MTLQHLQACVLSTDCMVGRELGDRRLGIEREENNNHYASCLYWKEESPNLCFSLTHSTAKHTCCFRPHSQHNHAIQGSLMNLCCPDMDIQGYPWQNPKPSHPACSFIATRSGFACVCYVCTVCSCVWVLLCACMWRPEIDDRRLSQSLSPCILRLKVDLRDWQPASLAACSTGSMSLPLEHRQGL